MSCLYRRAQAASALRGFFVSTLSALLFAVGVPTSAVAQPLPRGLQDITPVAPAFQPLRGFKIEASDDCGFDDPLGLYFNPTNFGGFPAPKRGVYSFTVTADSRIIGEFDLTGLGFVRWSGVWDRSDVDLTIRGFRGSVEVITVNERLSESGPFGFNTAILDLSGFTKLTRFTIEFEGSRDAVGALTFDSFAVANPQPPWPPGWVGATPFRGHLANLSARARLGAGPSTCITGFVLNGSATDQHEILLRAVGPSLASFGVDGALPNPALRLSRAGEVVAQNDDWSGASAVRTAEASAGAFALGNATRDAAFVTTLRPGTYDVQTTPAVGTATGVALTEIYEIVNEHAAGHGFANFSVRAEVGAGENALIAGFVVKGATPVKLLVRGAGPGLDAFGVTGALRDPRLRIYRGPSLVGANEDANDQARAAGSSVGAFPLPAGSRDAALQLTLPAGVYTAILSSADGVSGIGLLELYELP